MVSSGRRHMLRRSFIAGALAVAGPGCSTRGGTAAPGAGGGVRLRVGAYKLRADIEFRAVLGDETGRGEIRGRFSGELGVRPVPEGLRVFSRITEVREEAIDPWVLKQGKVEGPLDIRPVLLVSEKVAVVDPYGEPVVKKRPRAPTGMALEAFICAVFDGYLALPSRLPKEQPAAGTPVRWTEREMRYGVDCDVDIEFTLVGVEGGAGSRIMRLEYVVATSGANAVRTYDDKSYHTVLEGEEHGELWFDLDAELPVKHSYRRAEKVLRKDVAVIENVDEAVVSYAVLPAPG
jgi:hypothetical protein